jgi:L-histidine N-alpha-methyltransferase
MPVDTRLSFIEGPAALRTDEFCKAVHDGLIHEPKWLPSRFFYDRLGSELFEQITTLHEYYPTGCEAEILANHAEGIAERAGQEVSVVEFGSGSSTKTRRLISAILAKQSELSYVTIDISRDFLRESAEALLADYPRLNVTAIAAEYTQAIKMLPQSDTPRLILFLGSSLGNFIDEEAIKFLRAVQEVMSPQDTLLVGVDLEKDRSILHLAYNDPQGVTAAFNLNLLARINRELHGNFVTERFQHLAVYDEAEHRIEMRLISDGEQHVHIDDLDTNYHFADQEYIVTEWSHKYTRASFQALAAAAGLKIVGEWKDRRGWFSEFLLQGEPR